MHGAAGHGGSTPGSRISMWFTQTEDGGYGVIIMTNHKQTYKPDNGVYAVSVYLTIQQLLMEEAHERHLNPDNT